MDPAGRMTCDELLDHSYFDHFRDWFKPELDMLLAKDAKKIAKSKSRMHVCTHNYCLDTHTHMYPPYTIPHTHVILTHKGRRDRGGAGSLMSSSTPHASSGAASGGATATATNDDRHLPQLKTLKEKPHRDPSTGKFNLRSISVHSEY
jgi:hypothetical protein